MSRDLVEKRLEAVSRITQGITRGEDFTALFADIHRNLKGLVPFNRLALGLLDPTQTALEVAAVYCDGETELTEGYQGEVAGSSLAAILKTGECRIINDLAAYSEARPSSSTTKIIVKEGMRSSLTVPLLAADRRIGVMWFSSRDVATYKKEHEGFMRLIAGQLAIAVERGLLLDRLRRDNSELAEAMELKNRFLEELEVRVADKTRALTRSEARARLLLRLAEKLHASLDLEAGLAQVIALLSKELPIDAAAFLHLDQAKRSLAMNPIPSGGGFPATTFPLTGSVTGKAMADRTPRILEDLAEGTEGYEDTILQKGGYQSRVILPLVARNRPVGGLLIARRKPGPFPEADIVYLRSIADHLSAALANRAAYTEIEALTRRLRKENVQLKAALNPEPDPRPIIGTSVVWTELLDKVRSVAPTGTSVLIRGETGTGKELLARAIHRLSPRSRAPFVAVNCAALSAELFASELFGHERGAFTGAVDRKLGRIEIANGGTLFLDEIGDIPSDIQVGILRVLQEREFERLGGTRSHKVDVRIVAASNRDLEAAIEQGRFRDDLFFRLNVFPLRVPPLRERAEDVEPLILYFLERYAPKIGKSFRRVAPETIERCRTYPWPGNVRELENLVERCVILEKGPDFRMDPGSEEAALATASPGSLALDSVVRRHLVRTLRTTGGRIYGNAGAARLLGVKPSTLQAKLKKLGIDRKQILTGGA